MTIQYFPAAKVSELTTGKMKKVIIESEVILLANIDGGFYAVSNICTHEDASLYLGCLKGKLIQCSLHEGKFDVTTGEPAEEPAEIPLQTYPTQLHGDIIEIGIQKKQEG